MKPIERREETSRQTNARERGRDSERGRVEGGPGELGGGGIVRGRGGDRDLFHAVRLVLSTST